MTTDIDCPMADIQAILDQYSERTQMHIACWVFAKQCGVWATPRMILTQLGEEAPPECHDDPTQGVHLLLEAASESTRCDGGRECLPTLPDRPIRAGDGGQRPLAGARPGANGLVPSHPVHPADRRGREASQEEPEGAA